MMKKLMKQSFFKSFRKQPKNRGTMWASLFSIGIGAVILGLTRSRGKQNKMVQPLKNALYNMNPRNNNINAMGNAAFAEFSEELLASALNKDKQNQ
jgi:hypothetical protein